MIFPSPNPLIVIGMHRSGTSLLAELLARLGVYMGAELDIHHEAWFFKRANKALLALADAHWAKPRPFVTAFDNPLFRERCRDRAERSLTEDFSSYGEPRPAQVWGWKDPRTTLTLPVWLDLWPRARIVYLERDGLDVALSLQRRELRRWTRPSDERRLLPPTLGACLRLAAFYRQQGKRFATTTPSLSIHYEDLLARPVHCLRQVCAFAELPVTEDHLEDLRREIRQPTQRSGLERLRVGLLERLGLLDLPAGEDECSPTS